MAKLLHIQRKRGSFALPKTCHGLAELNALLAERRKLLKFSPYQCFESVFVMGQPHAFAVDAFDVGDRVVVLDHSRLEEVRNPTFDVLFEDDDVLVIDKPSGILVHASKNQPKNDVLSVLTRQRGKTFFPTFRLDRETSGVLVLAKHAQAASKIQSAIQHRDVHKTYVARVTKSFPLGEHRLEHRLARDVLGPIYTKRVVDPEGKLCITLAQRFSQDPKLVKLTPLTGRTHQLRAQLDAIGCPIVGDPLYGQDPDVYFDCIRQGRRQGERLMLHHLSWSLGAYSFSAHMPESFCADST